MYNYILNDDGTTTRISFEDYLVYLKANIKKSNSIERTTVKRGKREFLVSTVFLSIDHNFNPEGGLPVLFETMIFPPESYLELYCLRYSTIEEAREGHKAAVQYAKKTKIKELLNPYN